MKIDLSKIERESQSFAEDFIIDGERLDTNRVDGPMEVRLEGKVRPAAGHFLVDGRASAHGQVSCGRCLKPVAWKKESSFSLEIALTEAAPLDPELALDDGDLDIVFLEEPFLDLEELAAEQVMLELPIRVLCSEDCAGLCPSCGADLNVEGACDCEPDPDPRWAALKDLEGQAPGN